MFQLQSGAKSSCTTRDYKVTIKFKFQKMSKQDGGVALHSFTNQKWCGTLWHYLLSSQKVVWHVPPGHTCSAAPDFVYF